MATSTTAAHPAAEDPMQAASCHVAAEHHHQETAHQHNQGNHDEAKEHVAAANKHGEMAQILSAEATKQSQKTN